MSDPNPEQTASIISLMTYTHLDPVVFLGGKVPHLRADQLLPLADYDYAKYRTEKAFSVSRVCNSQTCLLTARRSTASNSA